MKDLASMSLNELKMYAATLQQQMTSHHLNQNVRKINLNSA